MFPDRRHLGRPVAASGFPADYLTSRLGSAFVVGDDWQASPALSFGKGTGGSGPTLVSDPPRSDSLTATPPGSLAYPSGFQHTDAHIQYVSDPLFLQVARARYPYCTVNHFYNQKLYTYSAKNKVWLRQVVKFEANQYTTRGSDPAGANSHKLMFLTWAGGVGNRFEIEFSNTTQYIQGGAQTGRTFTEAALTGHALWGAVTTEWTGGQWWEYILNYEIRTAGADGQAIARQWKRQLTVANVIDPQAYEFSGWFWNYTGGTAPAQAGGYQFWGNRNRSADLYPDGSARPELSSGHDPFHVYYGPHEVVDGEINNDPYSLQGTGE